jgi:general secretion pathway protein K
MTLRRRKGAALIVVLLLAATLSLVALSIAEIMSRSAERSTALRARSEALWIAFGAEQLTLAAIRAGVAASAKSLTGDEAWIGRPMTLPLEQGEATVVIVDATRCFNLNSLVYSRSGGRLEANAAGLAAFATLAAALRTEASSGEASIAAAAADWVDADTFNEPLGAEDGAYLSEKIPRRTGGTYFAHPTELRAVRGVTGATFKGLRRMLCALPSAEPHQINVNMLEAADAPVLVALTQGAINAGEAASVIADKPPGGYGALEEFWSHPVLKERKLPEAVRGRTSLRSRYFEARAVINHGGQSLHLTLAIEASQSGEARVIRRRLGPVE